MTEILANLFTILIKLIAFLIGKRGDGLVFLIQKKLDKKSYFKKKILDRNLIVYSPNQIVKWRYDTLLTKEPETIEWIESFEGQKIVFWDIGANVGIFSIYAAIKHKNSRIIAFEPSTSNLRVLSRNISVNNLHNKIFINQLPLFDKKNQFQIMNENNFEEGNALNSFSVNYGCDGKKYEPNNRYFLFGTSLNFFVEENILEIPDYIKLDVDGIEDLILSGSDSFLKDKKVKSILVEINEDNTDQKGKLINLLKKNNFKLMYKKHSNEFDTSKKYSGIYNYVFNKHD